jgi:hypothetical protein
MPRKVSEQKMRNGFGSFTELWHLLHVQPLCHRGLPPLAEDVFWFSAILSVDHLVK